MFIAGAIIMISATAWRIWQVTRKPDNEGGYVTLWNNKSIIQPADEPKSGDWRITQDASGVIEVSQLRWAETNFPDYKSAQDYLMANAKAGQMVRFGEMTVTNTALSGKWTTRGENVK